MKKKNLNKKGALEAKMLITIILLIVGFGIILFMYSQLNWTGNIDREVCHESVILRGTLPDIIGTGSKDIVPLKCKTRNICITSKIFGKGECEKEFGEKEKYDTIRISNNKKEDDIKMVIAREMADCWGMMGEGKIQVFKRDVDFSLTKNKGVICSMILFDDSIKENPNNVGGMDKYLENHKVPNKDIFYVNFLTSNVLEDSISNSKLDIVKNEVINLDEKQIIVFIEFDKSYIKSIVGGFLEVWLKNYFDYFEGDYTSRIFLTEYGDDDLEKLKIDVLKNIP